MRRNTAEGVFDIKTLYVYTSKTDTFKHTLYSPYSHTLKAFEGLSLHLTLQP